MIYSLDEFIEKNRFEIKVHELSEPVKLENMCFLPGAFFELSFLKNQGYKLEVVSPPECRMDTQSFGFAYLLDREGKRMGYHLISQGGTDHFSYVVEDDGIYDDGIERIKKSERPLDRLLTRILG